MDEFAGAMVAQMPVENPLAIAALAVALVTIPLLLSTAVFHDPPLFWPVAVFALTLARLAKRKITHSYHREVRWHGVTRAALYLAYAMVLGSPVLYVIYTPYSVFHFRENRRIIQATSNCRGVILALRIFSGDNSGCYPDSVSWIHSSNDVFRELFRAGAIDNEIIFGCPASPFEPDGNLGIGPDYPEAVRPGENHWAFTAGLTDSAPGNIPLVYENVTETTWPPKWNPNLAGKAEPGRTWAGARIIIGFNDCSVSIVKLDPETGAPLPLPDGKPVFPPLEAGSQIKVLNAAR